MLAVFFLCGSTLLGVCLVRRALRELLDGIEQILWGTVAGWVLATFAVYFIARWQGQLTPKTVLWVTLAIWIAAILIVVRGHRSSVRAMWDRGGAYTGLMLVLLVLAPVYWRLLSVQMFPRGDGGLYSGSAGNDLNFPRRPHFVIQVRAKLPPTYTLLPPERLLYPFMPDFHAAVLMAGAPVYDHQ